MSGRLREREEEERQRKGNNIDDSRDGGSNDETSNHVQLDTCLMATDFSNYVTSNKHLATSHSHINPQLAENSATRP